MLPISSKILDSVKEEFDNPFQSVYSIYIHFMNDTGLIIFEDRKISADVLQDLIHHGKLKCEGVHFHQGEKCIRYRFKGYKYPAKFYRSIPRELKRAVMEKDNESCVECGSYHNLQIDHVFPWSKGGLTELNNLQVLCKKCNYAKSNKY